MKCAEEHLVLKSGLWFHCWARAGGEVKGAVNRSGREGMKVTSSTVVPVSACLAPQAHRYATQISRALNSESCCHNSIWF